MTLPTLLMLGIRASLVLLVLGAGLTATPGDATSLLVVPVRLVRTMTAMLLLVPLFGLILAHMFELEPVAAITVAGIAVSPIPAVWPKPRYRISDRDSSPLGVVVASAVLSTLLDPIALAIFGGILSIPLDIPAGRIATIAMGAIVVPLFAAIGIARLLPAFAHRVARGVTEFAASLLAVSSVALIVSSWRDLSSLVGDGTMLTMVGVALAGLGAGYLLGGPSEDDRWVLALASASRHPGLALMIAQATLPQTRDVPAAVALYVLVSTVVCLPVVLWRRRQLRRHDESPLIALR